MDRLALVKELSFGAQVAEDETTELAKYFVETDQWVRIYNGEVDVIRGHKGSGKSAIYSLLSEKSGDLFDKGILLISAEKPRGTPVFKELVAEPPTSEIEFVALWKLYIVSILAQQMREYQIDEEPARVLYSRLEEQGLLESKADLTRILKAVKDYARRYLTATVEAELKLEPTTGAPVSVRGKITPSEPSVEKRKAGFTSVDELLALASAALGQVGVKVWVLLDRLDVAFAETHDLERNALRALFRVYLDLAQHETIRLKIFLRSDIWSRIVEGGFREASHITKVAILEWKSESLLNLVIRRILNNPILLTEYKFESGPILKDFAAQRDLFYRLFPAQVEQGSRKTTTWDWMVTRCADGTGKTAPRELIHLLISLRHEEIARIERGEDAPPTEQLFDRSVFKAALPAVSEARLVQNLYAEYPELKSLISKLSGQKTEQTIDSLGSLWGLNQEQSEKVAENLIEVGFFQTREKGKTTFWVPFIFRDALKMSQGLADES